VVEEIATHYKTGRPVLVGTTSIEKNELLSSLLRKRGIPHELLNAKNHEQEAAIIAAAGKKGAVTVATNMAGRGVDTILGGMPPSKDQLPEEEYKKEREQWQKDHDEVLSLGGLYVMGTERHESRRIDNQLRGRSGRQGDPGETCFFVALEDDLMRIFGGEQISKLMTFFNFPEDQPLSHSMVSKAIEQAQVKVEGFNFDIRKHLVDYDDVLNKQRDIIYTRRRNIVELDESKRPEFRKAVFEMLEEEVRLITANIAFTDGGLDRASIKTIYDEFHFLLPLDPVKLDSFMQSQDIVGLEEWVIAEMNKAFDERESKLGTALWYEVVKSIYLATIDKYWTDHLTAIENLREGINLRGYAQLDPLVEYKNEAFSMFEKLIDDIDFEVSRRIFKVEVEAPIQQPAVMEQSRTYKSAASIDPFTQQQKQLQQAPPEQAHVHAEQAPPQEISGFKVIPPGTVNKKPGRNEPCWCGSGKKYKKCHWPN
jgi:preprotein translocase subunit SecA